MDIDSFVRMVVVCRQSFMMIMKKREKPGIQGRNGK
jgi:hypothetical protein